MVETLGLQLECAKHVGWHGDLEGHFANARMSARPTSFGEPDKTVVCASIACDHRWLDVLFALLLVLLQEHFLLLTALLATPPARHQNEACGNCRGRSSSLSEIMQIVTSAVRFLWPAKVTRLDDLTCLYKSLVSSAI